MKRLFLALAAALALAAPAEAQTVILVRHAEKALEPKDDPPLSASGQARAQALAHSLQRANVTLILTSTKARTVQTAAVLARASGAPQRPISLSGATDDHIAAVATEVRRASPDAVVVVVGHSNTVPEIARALGYAAAEPMSECEYDRMIVLQMDASAPTAIVTRYGAPTAGC